MERYEGVRRAARFTMHRFHHSGTRPIKVLLIGDSADLLASDAESTLAERIADRMWLQTRHGVDVDVLTDLAPVLRAVQGAFDTWRLWRYDVVVVVLGVGVLSTHHPRTLTRVGDLLQEVLDDSAGATDVVVLGKRDEVLEDHGRPGDAAAHRLQHTIETFDSERVRFRGVTAETDPVARDRAWAFAAAEEVAASITALGVAVGPQSAAVRRGLPDEEAARQRALDALGVVGRGPDTRLNDLVELARAAFGTESAEINFIDHDRQWKMAVAGAERGSNPRVDSFCSLTIQQAEPLVVSDTRLDPLLRFSPLAMGPHPIRFYAAHPIESADGYRIGSFCVYDPEPRDVDSLDLAVLRDLALLAQAEISGVDAAPAGLDARLTAW